MQQIIPGSELNGGETRIPYLTTITSGESPTAIKDIKRSLPPLLVSWPVADVPNLLRRLLQVITGVLKAQSIEYVEVELRELENVFALILLGSFIGLPSPPTPIALRLLPYMARELLVMRMTSERLDDMLAEMAGIFEVA